MSEHDSLRQLLIEFFGLPSATAPEALTQRGVPNWDSLAMVQLISELQATYQVAFELDEIERLTSYEEIRAALAWKKIVV